MPRDSSIPHWRSWTMQGSLWLVFAGTILLAWLLQAHQQKRFEVHLENSSKVGVFQVRRPAGWEQHLTPQGVIYEEGSQGLRRRIEIRHAYTRIFLSPLEYLVRSGELLDVSPATTRSIEALIPDIEPAVVGGWPGILLVQKRDLQTLSGGKVTRKLLLACSILPSGDVLLVRLDGDGDALDSDEQLVRRIGEQLHLEDTPTQRVGGELDLPQGISIALPRGFATGNRPEKFRIGTTLLHMGSDGWLGIDVTPCYLLPNEPLEEQAQLLMAARDPLLAVEKPRLIDENTCVSERAATKHFPALVYVRRNADGRGVIAEFRWQGADRSRIEALWQDLQASLQFEDENRLGTLIALGEQAVAALPRDAVDLLKQEPLTQKWQWYHETIPTVSKALMRLVIEDTFLVGFEVTTGTPPPGNTGEERISWMLMRDWQDCDYELKRTGRDSEMMQHTRIAGDRVMTIAKVNALEAKGAYPRGKRHIPAALLRIILPKLPFSPMLLQSDGVVSPEWSTTVGGVQLILEPSFDVQKYEGDSKEPMRCWSIRVNGSSTLSRWYLDGSGKVVEVSFGGQTHLQRLDADEELEPPEKPE